MSETFSLKTLGCKANQYESSLIAASLEREGMTPVPFGEASDIVIINTCTVTDNSDRKCRNYIRQGAGFSRSGKVIVTGCLARRDPTGIGLMQEVAALVDTSDRGSLAARIMKSAGISRHSGFKFSEEDALPFEHTRSFLRVQDGCDGECSYCIVPSVRGKPVSRSFDETIRHAQKLIDAGIPEIVLTGITIGKYLDSNHTLAGLAERILSLTGNFRLRITSIEPTHLTDELVALFNHAKLCPHIHLPLQSGSDPVLEKMYRPYTADFFRDAVDRLRITIPDIAIGTDIIVGFPGETEDQFQDTIKLCKEIGFAFVHQFAWSPRKGTVASDEKRIPGDIVAERSAALRALTRKTSRSYASRFVSRTVDSIIEKGGDALTPHYLKVTLHGFPPESPARKILPVHIESLDADGLHGVIL